MSLGVLLLGGHGQLGQSLAATAPASMRLQVVDRSLCDFTDAGQLAALVAAAKPQVIINCAAYTAVDKAETDVAAAFAVNAALPAYLAALCDQHGARLVHFSTDYVFDGSASQPYAPEHKTNPLSVYGRSKAEGEAAILAGMAAEAALIIRTQWLYRPGSANFVATMIRLLRTRDVLRVVADQIGTPSAASGLAAATWRAVAAKVSGLQHFSDAGVASWYDFALAIRRQLEKTGAEPLAQVLPCRTADYPTAAQRPAYAVLDKARFYAATGQQPEHWQDVLAASWQAGGWDT